MNTKNKFEDFFDNRANRLIHKCRYYFPVYERHFSPFKGKPITILEIGVQNGGSLEMWRDYFGKDAEIVGLDIDPRCKALASEDFDIIIGSQDDPAVLEQLVDTYGRFDVILDDASHIAGPTVASFETLFPFVKPGGVYMIEDLGTAFYPEYAGGVCRPGTGIELVKTMIDNINADCSKEPGKLLVNKYTRMIGGIHAYSSMVVFDRVENNIPDNGVVKGTKGL